MTDVRSEQDKVSMAPIKVQFGEEAYEIKPLRINAARKWRAVLISEISAIAQSMQVDSTSAPKFFGNLAFIFLQFPEKMAELVFSYAADLDRSKIEEEATEEQVSSAFGKIVQVAFPFTGELQTISQVLGVAASFPASAKFTS